MKRIVALALTLILIMAAFAGCKQDVGEASVQKVSMILGISTVGISDHFAGIVSARGETEVKQEGTLSVGKFSVAVGDVVNVGDVLYTYDLNALSMSLEKARLEYQRQVSTLESYKEEKAQIQKDLEEAEEEDTKVTLALELREINVSILEAQYQMSSKANEISSLQKSMSEPSRLAEIGGTVKSINDPNSSDYDSTKPLIVLVEAGGYRVKGKINEMNANALPVGSEVTIASRMTDETWKGTISMIDWEHPGDGNEDRPYYVGGGSDEMSQSTKYPFYVELDDPTGLKLGQHVYIRLAEEDLPDVDNSIWLGSYYIVDVDSDPYVWAQDQNGKLEKRHVELGVHDEDMDTYVVQSGLTLDDYIAFPDETLKVGMKCITFDESSFTNSAETPVEE